MDRNKSFSHCRLNSRTRIGWTFEIVVLDVVSAVLLSWTRPLAKGQQLATIES